MSKEIDKKEDIKKSRLKVTIYDEGNKQVVFDDYVCAMLISVISEDDKHSLSTIYSKSHYLESIALHNHADELVKKLRKSIVSGIKEGLLNDIVDDRIKDLFNTVEEVENDMEDNDNE